MKKIAVIIAIVMGFTLNAQNNKNVSTETKTTTTTVNHGDEQKKVVKTEQVSTKQNLEFKDPNSKKLNKDLKSTPTQVTKTTTISGDGVPTQIGQISYYEHGGRRYTFISEKSGYRISSPDGKDNAVIVKTADGTYTYKTNTTISKSYFDTNGNFVVETHDPKNNTITKETYIKVKQ